MESKWVTFKVADEVFGFGIQSVREMLRLPKVYPVPESAPDYLGVVLLRSEVIPVFDLRLRFGLESAQHKANEMVELLQARFRDHENWLNELEASVQERREFTLTTDPHACKFGKWYDSFTTPDAGLARILRRFDTPHKQIHSVAVAVREHQAKGEFAEALRVVEATRSTVLVRLAETFREAGEQVLSTAQQKLIVLGTTGRTLGIAVDEICSVVACQSEEIQSPETIPQHERCPGLCGLLPQKGSERLIMLLDPLRLFSSSPAVPAEAALCV